MTRISRDSGGHPTPALRPGRTERLAVTGTTNPLSTAPARTTTHLRVSASVDIHYKIEDAPTATTNDPFLGAGAVEYIPIWPGDSIAVIASGASGFCTVSECS